MTIRYYASSLYILRAHFFAFDTLGMADFFVLCDSLFVARGHVMAI